MEVNFAETTDGRILRRWSRLLLILALLGMAWCLFSISDAMFGPRFVVAFQTMSGLIVITEKDLTEFDRAVLVVIGALPVLCWLYCLWQIFRLSQTFSSGEILSTRTVTRLERFGYGMAAQGIAEAVSIMLMAWYVVYLKKSDPPENDWQHVAGSGFLTSMIAAVLLVVVTRILRIGIRLREESELTI
jgi:hypothetical protein